MGSDSTAISSSYPSFGFRRQPYPRRAASPPTWACYEQIQAEEEDDSDSGSDDHSCSEDEEEYARVGHVGDDSDGDSPLPPTTLDSEKQALKDSDSMDVDELDSDGVKKPCDPKDDVKGKQRAIEPEPIVEESPKKRDRRRRREPVYVFRPILTIQKSQGFVWNQDLFVPPYIKDRYVASTSPPNSSGFLSTSASSATSSLTDYEVEVVEIRVKEGDLDGIIP